MTNDEKREQTCQYFSKTQKMGDHVNPERIIYLFP